MSLRTVYQTLRFKDNNEEVLKHGPYNCDKSNAWLHNGYYFWEEFIEPAHHWGKTYCLKKYIITVGECLILPEDLFDLVGNLSHIKEIRETTEYLREMGLVTEETTVAHIIDFLKKQNVFDYLATRANTTDSFNQKYKIIKLQYDTAKDAHLIMNPAVQICIYDLEKVLFTNFVIIFQSKKQQSA